MFLRLKIGLYAGEIREFPPEVARNLLAQGRAENPYAEPSSVPAVPTVVAALPAKSAPAKRNRR